MSSHRHIILIYVFLTVIPIIIFWQVKDFNFLSYDDNTAVTENQYVLQGITGESIRWALTSSSDANWIPLTRISHMVDVQLFGQDPAWHHRMNLLFHVANTVLLFFVLHRMTNAHWESSFVAALFALHPIHVESVAWVAERKDVLSAFFWLLTMAAYCFYIERPHWRRYLVVLILFTLGLMAKPMLVTLPFVLLLLDYWPLQRIEMRNAEKKTGGRLVPAGAGLQWTAIRPLLQEKAPLFALAAISSCITYLVQHSGGAVATMENLPFGLRLENAIVSYVVYIGKTIWPQDLAVLYPYPASLPIWQVVGAASLLAATTLAVVKAEPRAPYLSVGWLWYVGTLVPVIGIVQVGLQARADRYTYIPLIGLFIVVTWGVSALSRNWRYRKIALAALAVGVLLYLSVATRIQTAYWRNSETLFEHTANVTTNNHIAYHHLGNAYIKRGRYQSAIGFFDNALAIQPNNGSLFHNRGTAYLLLKRFSQAIADYNKALEINPKNIDTYIMRGISYANLGNYRQAITDYDMALVLNPAYDAAYNTRGSTYLLIGESRKALEDFKTAAKLGNKTAQDRLRMQGIDW